MTIQCAFGCEAFAMKARIAELKKRNGQLEGWGDREHRAKNKTLTRIAELTATAERLDKERIELAKMLLHYVRSVPLGNQPHMSAEIAEKMALVALGEF
ncbi:hypothetical protein UFOVP1165_38 [uncultured Caudovirales phage]|uniref:Uncharacterized protein n=1 Tax=uncultured Caudovirales phage TaxID=2100421 RepID=A0A6J5R600_9CAUD|nr:hypothetical protein UFOVP1165_38 [uncultured Caudovirales phage]